MNNKQKGEKRKNFQQSNAPNRIGNNKNNTNIKTAHKINKGRREMENKFMDYSRKNRNRRRVRWAGKDGNRWYL
jgi:hypothetical protein